MTQKGCRVNENNMQSCLRAQPSPSKLKYSSPSRVGLRIFYVNLEGSSTTFALKVTNQTAAIYYKKAKDQRIIINFNENSVEDLPAWNGDCLLNGIYSPDDR